ncbi:hypothetical protein COY28_01010 [Candidatus Woesearchaeota archaeon CG_4_10_14_0_2_um_filter_57_5]|nr:MAG: hypothetical protein AUJ68_03025 [Candidatus Woesearchaeota archaeon CG1_02_57_44]PIN69513.1 MAG: hypothetical protein COV94_02805 [Candidatus Woesearchaeota archaeon CG11_big_fil_rev_8_21_14_0_20_57_5]PIZ56351.1 MAG: hypothetical protein COY28_01010 [Candidatus Woesearchaeota archaeon CG_4_10_14_0_2_um_filter_57_5]
MALDAKDRTFYEAEIARRQKRIDELEQENRALLASALKQSHENAQLRAHMASALKSKPQHARRADTPRS